MSAKLEMGSCTTAIGLRRVGHALCLPAKVRSWGGRLKSWAACVLLSMAAFGGAVQAAQVEDPKAIADRVYAELKGGLNVDLSNALVNQYFDTSSMATHALGLPYRDLSNDQKNVYVQAFDGYFKKALYRFLITYKDVTISNLTSRIEGDRAIVRCVLTPANDQPINLSFNLFLGRENWKANDVVVNSVNLIVAYKPEFNRLYRQGGFDGLVAYLNSH